MLVGDVGLNEVLSGEHPGYSSFLEHEVLETISYPYEWSISMLADAAIHTLDLQLRLSKSGYALKDATPYNLQFVDGNPMFIDVSSIERPRRQDIWFALGQFSQMFTFPLLLCRFAGWNLRSYFQANLNGLGLEEMARNFNALQRLRPRILLDVSLPLWLHRFSERRQSSGKRHWEAPGGDASAQSLNLRRLRSKIGSLAATYEPGGLWSRYSQSCHYADEAEKAKKSLICDFLRSTRPARVLDLGCNTGDYSRLAVANLSRVVAIDSDHDAIEVLYRTLRKNPAPITPMVVDLCNPSPGIGFMNRERSSFLERVNADCVFALALMHHLLVTGNLPVAAICNMMYSLTKRDLVLEFVPTHDSMFEKLMRFRVNLFGDFTLDACRAAFLKQFRLLREESIPRSSRTLLFLRKIDA
jgi:hypothetical protein